MAAKVRAEVVATGRLQWVPASFLTKYPSVFIPADEDAVQPPVSAPAWFYSAIDDALEAAGATATPDASTTTKGKVELATPGETTTGTDTVRATTPAGVKAAIDAAVAGIPSDASSIVNALIFGG